MSSSVRAAPLSFRAFVAAIAKFDGIDRNAVEIAPIGHQIAKRTLVANGAGDLFCIAIELNDHGLVFVNDGTNAVDIASTR